MLFSELSKTERDQIAKDAAELINAFASDGKLGGADIPPGLELRESCREVILDLPSDWKDIFNLDIDIEQWVRRQVTWYHQLRTDSEEFGFARSIKTAKGHHVIEVVPSKVAHEFTKAIRSIDVQQPDSGLSGSKLPAVLLQIPRYSFFGLATVEAVGTESGGWGTITLVLPFFHAELSLRQIPILFFLGMLKELPDTFNKQELADFWFDLFARLSNPLKSMGLL